MTLTLRRQLHDTQQRCWTVLCDGVKVGAIVQPIGRRFWHWTITVQFSASTAQCGEANSREQAMSEFRIAWERYLASIGSAAWEWHCAHMEALQERVQAWQHVK